MKIAINHEERILLLSHSQTAALTLTLLCDDSKAIVCSGRQCDDLREACADLLQVIGFDGSYELTAEGVILEAMIDKLFV